LLGRHDVSIKNINIINEEVNGEEEMILEISVIIPREERIGSICEELNSVEGVESVSAKGSSKKGFKNIRLGM